MTDELLATFGLFGGACIVGFIAGMFPIVSIEVFLVGASAWADPTVGAFVLIALLASVGHQIAKTICYYAGIGALELPRGRVKERIERGRARIERWNKHPRLVMFLAATVGLPPLYLIAFLAGPLMHLRIVTFTVICFVGRSGRYATLMLLPQLIARW